MTESHRSYRLNETKDALYNKIRLKLLDKEAIDKCIVEAIADNKNKINILKLNQCKYWNIKFRDLVEKPCENNRSLLDQFKELYGKPFIVKSKYDDVWCDYYDCAHYNKYYVVTLEWEDNDKCILI